MIEPRIVVPTADKIAKEAYRLVAGQDPTAQQLDTAVKVWLEEALLDIWQFATHQDITRFKPLENSAVLVLTRGKRRYDLPEDYHRPIAATLLTGTLTGVVNADTADGDLTLEVVNDGDLEDYDYGTGGYALSGKYLVMTSGDGEGAMREIVVVDEGPPAEFTIDSEWLATELPQEGDTFFIATEQGQWIDEDMREQGDYASSRSGTGLPVVFNEFDNTLELDVAPDGANYAVLLRYWSSPVKINKESRVMEAILTNWRIPLARYLEWITARSIDDSRVTAMRADYEAARLALMEHEYDRGPKFAGFRPSR